MKKKYVIQIAEYKIPGPVLRMGWPPVIGGQLPVRHCYLLLSEVELQEDGRAITSPVASLHGLATKRGADGSISKVKPSQLFDGNLLPLPENMDPDKLVPEILPIGMWRDYLQVYALSFPSNQFGDYWLAVPDPVTVYEKEDSLAIWQAATHQDLLERLNRKLVHYSALGLGGGGGILPTFYRLPVILPPTINSNSVFHTMYRIMLGTEPPQLSKNWKVNALRPGIRNLMIPLEEVETLRSEFILKQNKTDEAVNLAPRP